MADDMKPDDFEELMRRMSQTKQFPPDLAAPLAEDKPMTEREAMQRVSALAARLRETTNKKVEEKSLLPASGKDARRSGPLAKPWALIEGQWKRVNSGDVGMNARPVTVAVLEEVFPNTPPRPAEALQGLTLHPWRC